MIYTVQQSHTKCKLQIIKHTISIISIQISNRLFFCWCTSYLYGCAHTIQILTYVHIWCYYIYTIQIYTADTLYGATIYVCISHGCDVIIGAFKYLQV